MYISIYIYIFCVFQYINKYSKKGEKMKAWRKDCMSRAFEPRKKNN